MPFVSQKIDQNLCARTDFYANFFKQNWLIIFILGLSSTGVNAKKSSPWMEGSL